MEGQTFYRARLAIFTILLFIISVLCFFMDSELNKIPEVEAIEVIPSEEIFKAEEKEEVVVKEPVQTVDILIPEQETETAEVVVNSYDWDADEAYLLANIAMAEAEGESIEGKALVICVVLNRVHDDAFPDTIEEVIFQHNEEGTYQFSPVKNGRFYDVEPNEDCWKALDMVSLGWDESQGALYFESHPNENNWHSRNLELLFQCGGHRFYK